jgi:hypothetical protein
MIIKQRIDRNSLLNHLKSPIFLTCLMVVFLATLDTFYFYQINLAPFPIFSFLILILIFFRKKIFIKKNFIKSLFLLYLIFYCSISIGLYYSDFNLNLNSVIGVLLGPLYFLFFYNYFSDKRILLLKVLETTLIIHLLFWYLQFFLFFIFDIKLDYLYPITGEFSRSGAFGPLTGLIRATGLFNEPASYSLMISMICFILISFKKKIEFIEILGLISCVLSFSISGLVFSLYTLFIYYLIFKKINFTKKVLMIGILIFLIIFSYSLFDPFKIFLENRLFSDQVDNSAETRFGSVIDFFNSLTFDKKFFGIGLANYDPNISTVSNGIFSFIIHFGYLLVSLIFILFYFTLFKLRIKTKPLFLWLVFLFGTMTYLKIYFWMMLSIIMIFHKKQKINFNEFEGK